MLAEYNGKQESDNRIEPCWQRTQY